MNYSVAWHPHALDDLRRLDRTTIQRIQRAVSRLASSGAGNIRPLKGSDEWRLRVGDWRVRFLRDTGNQVITVLRVLPRGGAYRDI